MSNQSESIDVKKYMQQLGQRVRAASREIGRAETAVKNKALNVIADRIDAETVKLKQANALDLEAGKAKGLDAALLDRLELTDERIESMSEGLRQI
ncbi:MAG: gamma-glutamyl-phosphate reductase, partial [Gammaproteobacteria bacterium]|nr:gamma-glutamyl-phosphate reductase [Gammaproteobacteria bacterium]